MPPESDLEGGGEHASPVPGAGVFAAGRAGPSRIALADGGALVLGIEGFRLVGAEERRGASIHPYDAVGHLYASDRVLLIGTDTGLVTLRDRDFASSGPGPEAARDALRARIGAQPDGEALLAEIDAVERLGEHDGPAWMIWATVALCLIGMAMQLADPLFDQVGMFMPELFVRGEYWRGITMHFLHDLTAMPRLLQPLLPMFDVLPIHLALNVAGMLVLGHLVERPLGPWRTAFVLAISAIGTIVGILLFGHARVLGASGLVAGLAGAMLALELHHPLAMPAYWRLPRRVFIVLLIVQFCLIDQLLAQWVAGGAHLGGFAGGYAATWLLGRPSAEGLAPSLGVRVAGWSAVALAILGFLGALPLARHDPAALERHATRLYTVPYNPFLYRYDNAAAWMIATEGGASDRGLDLAVALAERAVMNTGGLFPGVLDTLAEALFQRGDREAALLAIDEAIRLDPDEPYYREQRRRFTGERDPGDRPPPPGTPSPERLAPGIAPEAPRGSADARDLEAEREGAWDGERAGGQDGAREGEGGGASEPDVWDGASPPDAIDI